MNADTGFTLSAADFIALVAQRYDTGEYYCWLVLWLLAYYERNR
jgi:hypothetical protein